MVEDDDEEETCGSTSMESKISAIHLSNPYLREQPKTHGCLSPPTTKPTTEPTTSLVNRPISLSIALHWDSVEQAIRGGDYEAAATIYSPYLFPNNLKTNEIQHCTKRSRR